MSSFAANSANSSKQARGKPRFSTCRGGEAELVDMRAASELKTLLVGVPLPAEKAQLLEYAVQQHAEPQLLDGLQLLPDREYASLDEVAEGLVSVQPQSPAGRHPSPRAESGEPPGRDDYTDPHPSDTGRVRD